MEASHWFSAGALGPVISSNLPLYQHYIEEMLSEEDGFMCRMCNDPAQRLWDKLKVENAFTLRGGQTVKNRFLAVVRKLREDIKHAGQRQVAYLHCCLESDMVGNAKFARLVRSGTDLAKVDTTNSKR